MAFFRRRRVLSIAVLVVLAAFSFAARPVLRYADIAAGYACTVGALLHFGSGDSLERIRAQRLPPQLSWMGLEADPATRTVTASVFGLIERRARYRPGLGATRVRGLTVALPEALAVPRPLEPDVAWPFGSSPELAPLPNGVDARALERVLDDAFVAPSGLERGTYAIVVAVDGRLVVERHAEGYDRFTPLLGWSMTKSITALLVGRLIAEGRLALDEPPPVPEWSGADDPRRAIRLEHLLRMTSGLAFYQNHTNQASDSLRMLFLSGDCGGYAADQPLAHAPGTHWAYSDGTSNILARICLEADGDELERRLTLPRRLLFEPLGMTTAEIAVDGSGTFVGSSLMLASARDWARFGQFCLDDGVWGGQRLLPHGWMERIFAATPESQARTYGAGFWRFDAAANARANGALHPRELDGVVYAAGFEDQFVFLDRARRLVVVRLGVDPEPPGFDEEAFAASVLACFPEPEPAGDGATRR